MPLGRRRSTSSKPGGAPNCCRSRQNRIIRFGKPDSPVSVVLSRGFQFLFISCVNRSFSNWPLLPILDLTSTLPAKSIHIPINPLPIWMHIPHHVVFPYVGYMFPEEITQGSSRCPHKCARRTNYRWMNLLCLGLPISHSGDYQSCPSCVCNVPRYDEYLYSNYFYINASNHQECANVYQVLCTHNRFNQPSLS
jgi:hypothetical protein